LEHLDRTPWYLAIAGGPDLVRAQLASEVARKCQARLLAEPVFAPRLTDRADVPAVHACEIELEFLQRRVRPLAADQPEWQSTDRPTISDYWFDQSAATATACFPSEWREQYLEQCAEWQARIVQPRLLVLLRNSGQEVCSDAQARSDAALRSQAAVAGGPQLVLDTSEHAANV
jgi:hypothetical protein